MNHGLEIRSKPTIPDFFSPPQKKRAPKERFPVVNPMAKKLEISSTLNRKNRFEKDGLFWLQSFTNQIGRNKEMDYSIWNKWHIHIRYMICIYIYYLYVYIYNLYVYIYIYYIHTCTYIYIYTHLSNSWVYWAYRQILGPLTHQIPWIGSHLQIDPFLALQIHLYRYYIYIYVNIPLKPEASRVELHNCQISANMLKQPIFLALGFHFVWRPRGWKVMIHDRMWSALVVWLAPVRRATIGVRYGQVKVENLWRLVQQTKFGVNLLLGI